MQHKDVKSLPDGVEVLMESMMERVIKGGGTYMYSVDGALKIEAESAPYGEESNNMFRSRCERIDQELVVACTST